LIPSPARQAHPTGEVVGGVFFVAFGLWLGMGPESASVFLEAVPPAVKMVVLVVCGAVLVVRGARELYKRRKAPTA
jgi:hypothetical protein